MRLDISAIRGDLNSVRFAVKSGGKWYLSELEASGQQLETELTYTSGKWAAFKPSEDSSSQLMTAEGLVYIFDGSNLDQIESVGFFYEGMHTGTARARIRIREFTVETEPSPTAATLGLIARSGEY